MSILNSNCTYKTCEYRGEYLSRLIRKPTICICINKDADREANQRLCFCYTDSTFILLLKSEISSFYCFCDCAARFLSDLFGNHIVGFPMMWLISRNKRLILFLSITYMSFTVYAMSLLCAINFVNAFLLILFITVGSRSFCLFVAYFRVECFLYIKNKMEMYLQWYIVFGVSSYPSMSRMFERQKILKVHC